VDVAARSKPEELSEEQRQRLHRAHQRLRNASNALEALTVVEPVRGRWVATPVPAEALEGAQNDFHDAYRQLWRTHQELLCCEPPAGALET
jgi:DNA-binding SARP family transcriptional activator